MSSTKRHCNWPWASQVNNKMVSAILNKKTTHYNETHIITVAETSYIFQRTTLIATIDHFDNKLQLNLHPIHSKVVEKKLNTIVYMIGANIFFQDNWYWIKIPMQNPVHIDDLIDVDIKWCNRE